MTITVKKSKTRLIMVSVEYNYMPVRDFVKLRDILVCRLTLFNARRGEPSRLLLRQWEDAQYNEWLGEYGKVDSTDNEERQSFFSQNLKIAYKTCTNISQIVYY